jgi:hypothetical protein
MVKESELLKFLKQNPPSRKFVPYCYLNEGADALTVYFEGDPDRSERLSEHVTLYRSLENNEIVGCRIKGIARILEDLPNYITVNDGPLRLSIIFWAFRGTAENEGVSAMNDLARAASEHEMVLECAR